MTMAVRLLPAGRDAAFPALSLPVRDMPVRDMPGRERADMHLNLAALMPCGPPGGDRPIVGLPKDGVVSRCRIAFAPGLPPLPLSAPGWRRCASSGRGPMPHCFRDRPGFTPGHIGYTKTP